jgi:receptor expression-enhancing protein 5/6
MNQANEQKSSEFVHKERKLNFIEELERNSDIPANYILWTLGISLFLVYFKYIPLHLTNIIGIVFPVYWTLKSFENPQKGDNYQWIFYWANFTFFLILDLFMPNVLYKIPGFYFFKLLYFIWLFLPNTKGGFWLHEEIYSRMFGPLNLNKFYTLTDNLKGRFDKLLDRFGIDKSILDAKMDTTAKEQPGVMGGTDKNLIPYDTTADRNKEMTLEKIVGNTGKDSPAQMNFSQAQEELGESRQNIVGNAKIDTDNLRTSYQCIKDEIDHGIEKLKGLKGSLNEPLIKPTPLNQEDLIQQGRQVASQVRYNDPHQHESAAEKEYFNQAHLTEPNVQVSERIVTPNKDVIRFHADKIDLDESDKTKDKTAYWVNDKKVL